MWSKFCRAASNSLSNGSVFRNATSVCIAASMFDFVKQNENAFHVPTWKEVEEARKQHRPADDKHINARFFNDDHDKMIEEFTKMLEDTTHREILNFKSQIIEGISGRTGLRNGIVVEVGTGTGVFIPEFVDAVGPDGCYIGLDISPSFIYETNKKFIGSDNVFFGLNTEEDLKLPPELKGKVDVVFMCATYHHLSNVNAVLQQVYDCLRPGGKLVVVEFRKHDHHHGHGHGHGHGHEHGHHHHHGHGHKIDHQSALEAAKREDDGELSVEWIKQHIPFTEKQAKEEITTNGFIFEKDVMSEHWKDHFVHVYRKPTFF